MTRMGREVVNALGRPRKDVILVDTYDRHGAAPGLASAQFYLNALRPLNVTMRGQDSHDPA
jgi:spermidine synthase